MQLLGLHHTSSLTANAPQNLAFYTRVLGLRLVKKTVNQDDTSSYHLFYGDEIGNAGTEVTFFDIPHAAATRPGVSSISRIALRVQGEAALQAWQQRLNDHGIATTDIATEYGRKVLSFRDPEGLHLALVDDSGAALPGGHPWDQAPVPQQEGVRGLGAVTLTVRNAEPTAIILEQLMGFRRAGEYDATGGTARKVQVYETGAGGIGTEVHLDERTDMPAERLGRGGVHHVAFRVPNNAEYAEWAERLQSVRVPNSGPVDRYYFRSLYFREPNGILFELATDGPGFATDEDAAHLGERLALPPFLEPQRAQIEASLKPLDTK